MSRSSGEYTRGVSTASAPLIAVVGSTGTGKSELAISIALAHNGEIINGDAMQLYTGLPIITNKVTHEEQKSIPHHLLGEIGLDEPTWTVSDFVWHAQKKIKDIRSRGKLPILVGGTHYYTQSLLFADALAENGSGKSGEEAVVEEGNVAEKSVGEGQDSKDLEAIHPILSASPAEILAELRKVDPVMADRWHPNDHRKIRRSLEIYFQTGRPASKIYSEQRAAKQSDTSTSTATTIATGEAAPTTEEAGEPSEAESAGSTLRTRTLVLWVNASPPALQARLDARVDKMIAQGLLSEVSTLYDFALHHASSPNDSPKPALDTTRGMFVSIGYKEFLPYQAFMHSLASSSSSSAVPTPTDDQEIEKQKTALLADAIEKTKIATRQYAKRQTRWIRIKLSSALASASLPGDAKATTPNFYLLDSTDLSAFDSSVCAPGVSLVDKFLKNEKLPPPESLSAAAKEELGKTRESKDLSARRDLWVRRECEYCEMVAVTESDWVQHVKSRRHKLTVKKARASAEGKGDVNGKWKGAHEGEDERRGDDREGQEAPYATQ